MKGYEHTYLPTKHCPNPPMALVGVVAAFIMAAVCLALTAPAIAKKQKNDNGSAVVEAVEKSGSKEKQERKDEEGQEPGAPAGDNEEEAASEKSEDILKALKTTLVINVRGGNEKGNPVKGARVRVKCGDDVEFSHKTNSEGRAVIKDVMRGKVEVWVTASKWKTKFESYTLSKKDEEVNIFLEKPSH